jgi:GH25 family lysozyme M1 (1,4-beta-N-acetylmuramidase)
MWQYTQSGTCPGVNPPVDLNWFYGTAADLRALAVSGD